MDEDIFAILAGQEAVALGAVEPFDRANNPFSHFLCSFLIKK
jgi:hypothetical protein